MSKLKSISVLRQEDREFFRNFPLIFWLIFIVFGVLLMIPVLIYIGFSAKAYTGNGAGTADEPYQIATCDQLQSINQNTSAYYVLVQDVDCSDTINWNQGAGFMPINDFSGHLDGRNFSIVGLYINRTLDEGVGLFRNLSRRSYIENIFFEKAPSAQQNDISIVGKSRVGALAGYVEAGDVIIQNVHSELNISAHPQTNSEEISIGGLIGFIINWYQDQGQVSVKQNSTTGKVSISQNSNSNIIFHAGGLVGLARSENPNGKIFFDNNYSKGEVSSTNIQASNFGASRCGGLIGIIRSEAYVQNSYSMSNVNCPSPEQGNTLFASGGLVGLMMYNTSTSRIVNTYAGGEVTSAGAFTGGDIRLY